MAERLSENSAVSVCAAMLLLEKIATRSIAASQERKSSDQAIRCQQEKNTFQFWIAKKEKIKAEHLGCETLKKKMMNRVARC